MFLYEKISANYQRHVGGVYDVSAEFRSLAGADGDADFGGLFFVVGDFFPKTGIFWLHAVDDSYVYSFKLYCSDTRTWNNDDGYRRCD